MEYLVSAYLVIWAVLFGYILKLNKDQKHIMIELAHLKDKIGK